MAGCRFHRKRAAYASSAFFDRYGAEPQTVEFVAAESPGKTESVSVVVNHNCRITFTLPQFYHDMCGPGMLFYVV